MLIEEIVKNVKLKNDISNILDKNINNICIDSRKVSNGDLFICIDGGNESGTSYYMQALENGASVIVSSYDLGIDNQIIVENTRKFFALACKNFFHNACDKMKIIGVTGTNGKTTTTHIIYQILKESGRKVGLIGTLGVKYDNKIMQNLWTTPDPDVLHKAFFEMYSEGVEYVVMEVSAHAIEQKKIEGINFEVGVLTNITQDHLDYFKTIDNYAKTKLSFFENGKVKLGVVCADDEKCRRLIEGDNLPILSYGIDNPCDVFAIDVETKIDGSSFTCNLLDNIYDVKTNLVGEFNVQNILASITVCSLLGVEIENVLTTLNDIRQIEGRFNVIGYNNFNIVVDFAHTPDGLYKLLTTAKEVTDGNLYCAFGCGGNRDKDKRPKMGKIVEDLCDYVCVTSDNPRFENPFDIILDIEKGMEKENHILEENRFDAIKKMIARCEDGDTLVIAGKGGERYQEIKGIKEEYNDYDTIEKCIRDIYDCDFSLENKYV